MTIRPTLAVLLLVTALLLSSCSDDSGGSSDDAPTVEALAEQLVGDEARILADTDEARCVADAVVDDLGADRVEELDFRLLQPPLTDDEADDVYGAFEDCFELIDEFTASMSDQMTATGARCGATAYVESGLFRENLFVPERDAQLSERIDQTIAQAAFDC